MKVRCLRLRDSSDVEVEYSSWMTKGRVYDVLEVSVSVGDISLRILADNGRTPGYFKYDDFEVVDNHVSPLWCVKVKDGTYFKLTLPEWAVDSFWENFFDREPEAQEIFFKGYEQITGKKIDW